MEIRGLTGKAGVCLADKGFRGVFQFCDAEALLLLSTFMYFITEYKFIITHKYMYIYATQQL